MKILVLNCGSTSIKYKLFEEEKILAFGLIERVKDYEKSLRLVLEQLAQEGFDVSEISAVGHRVVHGGLLSSSCLINKKVINLIKKYAKLAPLHNPVNLKGILVMQKLLPKITQAAVFDTAFHQTMPDYAFMYALPYELYAQEGIRRYGFHGTSIKYVAQRAAELLKKPLNKINLIVCHLGAGCSICAVQKGKSVDTSMGFTPLEGLMMATRCGDVDPAISWYLQKKGKSVDEVYNLLNKKSGLLGVSGVSEDMRPLLKLMKKNKRAKLALQMFAYRLKKYIGAYAAVLEKVDAVVFTGGIGVNVPFVRSWASSKFKTLVIPTDEEKMIALETKKLVNCA